MGANRICSVHGCGKETRAKGLCKMHYDRMSKHGAVGGVESSRSPNGTGCINQQGYRVISGGKVCEHVAIVERVLGFKLPPSAVVHHVNENKSDNLNSNLVVCPSRGYHNLLHTRMRAMDACGNPNFRKCQFCKKYDSPSLMTSNAGGVFHHRQCKNEYEKNRRQKMENQA